MARIRKIDTKPELAVRAILYARGFRYRLHRRDLPGNPDIVFPSRRKVVLVHGCFWHRHDCPSGRKLPKSNAQYWVPKLHRNRARDEQNLLKLEALGWRTMIVWECEMSDLEALERRLLGFLRLSRRRSTNDRHGMNHPASRRLCKSPVVL
ncbi:very short patch repair endonuclease [Bradyrhizobium sp. ORS 86]|uniref:very short patch repair endonuclease n=1 Tax=Bradyrhizobium sp. ORS 86 TaxID=1685970 RepID=UPI00388EF5B5